MEKADVYIIPRLVEKIKHHLKEMGTFYIPCGEVLVEIEVTNRWFPGEIRIDPTDPYPLEHRMRGRVTTFAKEKQTEVNLELLAITVYASILCALDGLFDPPEILLDAMINAYLVLVREFPLPEKEAKQIYQELLDVAEFDSILRVHHRYINMNKLLETIVGEMDVYDDDLDRGVMMAWFKMIERIKEGSR